MSAPGLNDLFRQRGKARRPPCSTIRKPRTQSYAIAYWVLRLGFDAGVRASYTISIRRMRNRRKRRRPSLRVTFWPWPPRNDENTKDSSPGLPASQSCSIHTPSIRNSRAEPHVGVGTLLSEVRHRRRTRWRSPSLPRAKRQGRSQFGPLLTVRLASGQQLQLA